VIWESPKCGAFATFRIAVKSESLWQVIRNNVGLFVFSILLMTAFNFFSHGTQDLYPTFLQVQKHLSPHVVGAIAVIYNIGAILGGLFFGALSESIGRRRAIVIAALLALPMIPLWAYGCTPVLLAIGAFLMQVAVQGAWGIVPAHLNELSPERCAVHSPASPISSAICWRPAMPRCRPASPVTMAAITPSLSPWLPRLLPLRGQRWRVRAGGARCQVCRGNATPGGIVLTTAARSPAPR
jgi:SHS family lactate transporter-like MFS transporter